MNHSADASIFAIKLLYLQTFEAACATNLHTNSTFLDAVAQGCVEYITTYSKYCLNLEVALCRAAQYGQIESIIILLQLGAKNIDAAIGTAMRYDQTEAQILLCLRPSMLANAINIHTLESYLDAAQDGNLDYLIYHQSTDKIHVALVTAATYNRLDAVKLLIELGATTIRYSMIMATTLGNQEVVKYLSKVA